MSAIGITNTIPWIASLPGQGVTPIGPSFIISESGDILEDETGTDEMIIEASV